MIEETNCEFLKRKLLEYLVYSFEINTVLFFGDFGTYFVKEIDGSHTFLRWSS